ncbi:MAG: ATP-binding protein [Rhodospirillaceae bacterium]
MATTKQILEMIASHAKGDGERFLLVAQEIAEDAGRVGHRKLADDVNKMVLKARNSASAIGHRSSAAIPLARPRGELAGLVRAAYPERSLSDLALNSSLAEKLRRIVREHNERMKLEEYGLAPRRKFLFQGPPGTGKSMTAAAIAGELGLPLFTVLLDGVITKYMGETAAKLRLIFDAMCQTRGVYFFDEVDALAARRSNENDIGEARRTLNSFLMFLEGDSSTSIIIAATNHASLLDSALHRRFDSTFAYCLPADDEIEKVIKWNLLSFDTKSVNWSLVFQAASGLSHADLSSAAEDAARESVLEREGVVSTDDLVRVISERTRHH